MLNLKDNLGAFNPYYLKNNKNEPIFFDNVENNLISYFPKIEIDLVAVLELLNVNYILGDRTIIKNMYRSPWMSRYNDKTNDWECFQLPKHGGIKMSEADIADHLFMLLCDELKSYVCNHNKIGILLSGGMDSRVVAAVLEYLIENEKIQPEKIVAYTWGNIDSRDVVYAERIAKKFGWKWKHYTVSSDNLWENIKIAGKRGCEYTGFHLHAIPQISKDLEVDIILAGSYGDSVGRAEYSGTKVKNLKSIDVKFRNSSYLIRNNLYSLNKKKWKYDIEKYHQLFPREELYQYHEIDRQLHYMRRMLNPCMEILNEKVPVHQMFTDPKVFGFMWSLDVTLRNDNIYYHLLKKYSPTLLEIPWARTGQQYGVPKGEPDKYEKRHHSYSEYIENSLIHKIESRLSKEYSVCNTPFNQASIEKLIKLIREKPGFNFDFLEKVVWLTSFSFFLEYYNIRETFSDNPTIIDKFNANVLLPIEYNLRRFFRKIK